MASVLTVYKLNDRNIAYVLKSPNGNVGRYLTKKAVIVTAKAKAQAGTKTGALKRSINWRYGINSIGPYVRIGSSVPHAYLHHEGTGPRIIRPRKRLYLRFVSKGTIVFSRKVIHRGARPNRYLTDNLKWYRDY
jgi:hypothetical protein